MILNALSEKPRLPSPGRERPPLPGWLLPYCFSGRHLLELMVDFATDRTKKLVEFVFDW
jgi:hypothetical protein